MKNCIEDELDIIKSLKVDKNKGIQAKKILGRVRFRNSFANNEIFTNELDNKTKNIKFELIFLLLLIQIYDYYHF